MKENISILREYILKYLGIKKNMMYVTYTQMVQKNNIMYECEGHADDKANGTKYCQ